MKKLILFFIFGFFFFNFVCFTQADAGSYDQGAYYKAEIVSVQRFDQERIINAKIFLDDSSSKLVKIELGDVVFESAGDKNLKIGDRILVQEMKMFDGTVEYIFAEQYRLARVSFVFLLFVIFALIFTLGRGWQALLGLFISIGFVVFLLLPLLSAGYNPFWSGVFVAFLVGIFSILVAHGFKKTTLLALGSTLFTLVLAIFFAVIAVKISLLFGMGSEAAFYAQNGAFANMDLRGVLLAGILIGTVGVLDDITTTQTAAIAEIYEANNNLTFMELCKRGLKVGNEHIFSLINTLALAYAGASLPLLLLVSVDNLPWWVILNSEMVAEEVVRTLVGSTALLLAVPASTLLASWYFANKKQKTVL